MHYCCYYGLTPAFEIVLSVHQLCSPPCSVGSCPTGAAAGHSSMSRPRAPLPELGSAGVPGWIYGGIEEGVRERDRGLPHVLPPVLCLRRYGGFDGERVTSVFVYTVFFFWFALHCFFLGVFLTFSVVGSFVFFFLFSLL